MSRPSLLWLGGTAVLSALAGGAIVHVTRERPPSPPAVEPAPPPAPRSDRPDAIPDEVSRLVPELLSRGRKFGSLVSFEVENVDASGTLDPATGKLLAIFWRAGTPAEAGGEPRTHGECLRIQYASLAWTEAPLGADHCKLFSDPDDVLFEPRCSMRSLWALAKQRNHAPDGLAKLRYQATGGWFFYIHRDPPFGAQLPDACR